MLTTLAGWAKTGGVSDCQTVVMSQKVPPQLTWSLAHGLNVNESCSIPPMTVSVFGWVSPASQA